MTAKRRINITVDAEVHRKAHELGLNVSKVCENALKEAVRRLEQPTTQTETNGGYIDARSASRSAQSDHCSSISCFLGPNNKVKNTPARKPPTCAV